MPVPKNDITVLRELARRTMEVAHQDVQNERRELWRDFNSLKTYRVPVYVLDPQGMWREVCSEKDLACEDRLFRQYESWLRLQLYHASFGDDFITEPWITVTPVMSNCNPHWDTWGMDVWAKQVHESGAFHLPDPIITRPQDIARLVAPYAMVDQEKTNAKVRLLEDAVGDLIPVVPDYYPRGCYNPSFMLACLLGPEQMLLQLHDQPEMVHEISRLISSETIRIFEAAEAQGWFTNCNKSFLGNPEIQAMAYCHELPDPGPVRTVSMKQHWIYDCAQEFESVGPEMYEEFVLRYQVPLYERFGLTAYGCCENLTGKLKYLMKVKNLRRVAVAPWADVEQCAQQLQDKYVVSWRPHPAEMVTTGFDADRIKRIVQRAQTIFGRHGCHWEVNLKDFLSVEHDYCRLSRWVQVVREALGEQA